MNTYKYQSRQSPHLTPPHPVTGIPVRLSEQYCNARLCFWVKSPVPISVTSDVIQLGKTPSSAGLQKSDIFKITSLRKEQLIIDRYGLLSLSIFHKILAQQCYEEQQGELMCSLQISEPLHISSRATFHQSIQPLTRNAPHGRKSMKKLTSVPDQLQQSKCLACIFAL